MNPKNVGLWRYRGSMGPQHTRLAKALTDIHDGLNRWELWGTLGWHDIRQRYRRSIIGPFWTTLSMGIMVGALGFLYAQFFRQPIRDYLPFIALGIIIWGFISTLILDGCIAFTASESVIRQLRACAPARALPTAVNVVRGVGGDGRRLSRRSWLLRSLPRANRVLGVRSSHGLDPSGSCLGSFSDL